jgi:hypothetical protein
MDEPTEDDIAELNLFLNPSETDVFKLNVLSNHSEFISDLDDIPCPPLEISGEFHNNFTWDGYSYDKNKTHVGIHIREIYLSKMTKLVQIDP